jgi:hypothetical protein
MTQLHEELGNLEHYFAASVATFIELVSLASFGQRQHSVDDWLEFILSR